MKKLFIVTAFYNYDYDIRIKYVESIFKEKGYDVIIISSDFDHRKKIRYNVQKENVIFLKVPSYKSNLSLKRIWSHFIFARDVYRFCLSQHPDMLYIITPPNFLFFFFSKFKRRMPNSMIIYEFEDLWPESLPLSRRSKSILKPFMSLWALIRDRFIKCSDGYVFECDLFKDYLSKKLPDHCVSETIYLTKESESYEVKKNDTKCLNFLYLGSVNHLIDINLIVNFLKSVNNIKPAHLLIIGGGDNMSELLGKCDIYGIDYKNYGFVYEGNEKLDIISNCDFAFNVMKDTVFVGATMKSLEYFHYGIPIINTIEGDTYDLVVNYKCGFNINRNNYISIAEHILTLDSDDLYNMKKRSRIVFESYFTVDCFEKQFNLFVNKLL